MQFDARQAVASGLTIGMFVMLLHMITSEQAPPAQRFLSSSEEAALNVSAGEVNLEEGATKAANMSLQEETPEELWWQQERALQPCWSKHIPSRRGKTRGYVMVRLSTGPQYHPLQVADAVIVARSLGATLMLPTILEAAKEANSDFDKIYDVNNFISSLKDVVRVVGRLPENVRSMNPAMVKVPYQPTPDYIEEIVRPILEENLIIELITIFSPSSLKMKVSYTNELQAIQCLVKYRTLRFHPQVQKLGRQLISRVRKADELANSHFIAVDLHVDLLKQKGCRQPANSKKKKCFNAYDVGNFLKELGFSLNTAIYLTQSRWDQSLDPLKDIFPNVYTKEFIMPSNEEKQSVYSGNTQFEKAIDFYICVHSDVFVPAISGLFYVSVSGERISAGRTQILVPMVKEGTSHLQVSEVLSRFVTKKDHSVYSCLCKAPHKANESRLATDRSLIFLIDST